MRISDWSSDVCSSDLKVDGCRRRPDRHFDHLALGKRLCLSRRKHRGQFDPLGPWPVAEMRALQSGLIVTFDVVIADADLPRSLIGRTALDLHSSGIRRAAVARKSVV